MISGIRATTSQPGVAAPEGGPPSRVVIDLAKSVLRVASSSSDPATLLALGGAGEGKKSYYQLVGQLHPDKLSTLSPGDQKQALLAAQMVNVAWKACPENRLSTEGAKGDYQYLRTKLIEEQSQSRGSTPSSGSASSGIDPNSETRNAEWARAQAERRAEETARAQAQDAARIREAAIAKAKMELQGLDVRLDESIGGFETKLNSFDAAALLEPLRKYNEQVIGARVRLPDFDPTQPGARELLETYKVASVDLLSRICREVPGLKTQVGETKKASDELSVQLRRLREMNEVVRANVQILTKNSASPDEIQKWRDSLGLHTQQIERLATKLKAGNLALADTQTEVTKLWSAARLKLMQATGGSDRRPIGSMLTRAQETLRDTFNLERVDFQDYPAEWGLRIEMLSATFDQTTKYLEAELNAAPNRARFGGDNWAMALRGYLEQHIKEAQRFRSRISDDVWASLPEGPRAKLTSLLNDGERLEQAKKTMQFRQGRLFDVAAHVEGLDSSSLQEDWNRVCAAGR
jgi:hypothetical protein